MASPKSKPKCAIIIFIMKGELLTERVHKIWAKFYEEVKLGRMWS